MSKELALNHNESRMSLSGLNLELDNFINFSKDNIKNAANLAVKSIEDGECDAVDALIFTKKGSELFKELDSKIRPIAESKSIGVEFQKFGVKITEGMTGVRYDFTVCNDNEWQSLKHASDNIDKALKDREAFLKVLTKPLEIVDTETGETSTINPPVKSGKLGFTLTVK